ncbi:MAG TPA: superoxide dismutase [Gammaproteobacteria bacterium]|nr:superoxide dismutase [Gammaproteobacteria bacterium]
MAHELPKLPFDMDALAPHISRETLEYHHGKHHKKYVDTLNSLIPGTEFENMSLEETVKKSSGKMFNQAGQIWNHNFYWNCLTPSSNQPQGDLEQAINQAFGSLDAFKSEFNEKAGALFGSGWAWLVKKSDGSLGIAQTANAETPIQEGRDVPLLTCDVWEHAYYIDYRNARPDYLKAFWNVCNWDFVAKNFSS